MSDPIEAADGERSAISRRRWLRLAAAGAMATTMAPSLARAQTTRRAAAAPATLPADREPFTFALGRSAKVTVVSDGALWIEPRKLFPSIKPAELKKACEDVGVPVERHLMPVACVLIERGKDRVLIDAGCGTTQGPTAGHLVANLRAIGVEPESITDVAPRSGQLEHIGGLLDAAGTPTFSNAKIWISTTARDYWLDRKPRTFPDDSPLPVAVRKRRIEQSVAIFAALKGRIEVIPSGHSVGNDVVRGFGGSDETGVTSYLTRVHEDRAQDINILGEHFAPFALQLARPEWPSVNDRSAKFVSGSRVGYLKIFARDKQRILCTSAPPPYVGLILPRDGGGYRFEPHLEPIPRG